MQALIFFLFAALAVGASIGMVLARNPVHSALLLVAAMVSVAVFFLEQDADLLAAVQIIVYASAVVVLFLFVIMLLGIDRFESRFEPLRFQRPTAVALGAIVCAETIYLAGHEWVTGEHSGGVHALRSNNRNLGGNVERVARALFVEFLWPFELTAALLVIAVVGSVVLARRSGQRVEIVEEPPTDAPDPLTDVEDDRVDGDDTEDRVAVEVES